MQTRSKSIWITTSFVGFHRWPEAPPAVVYLSHPHRHLFNVRVEAEVEGDRSIEFHLLKQQVETIIQELPTCGMPLNKISIWSCEEMAQYIATDLLLLNPATNSVRVSVDEDGECGATVHVTRD